MATVRHKCFISYQQVDEDEVAKFIDDFSDVFIPKILGVSDTDDFIDSTDTDYVMRRIRELYLTDSTVTIVMIGKCTWARRYVDWETASSLRNDPKNKRSGLMAITLKSVASSKQLLPRVDDNVDGEQGYARWWKYPTSSALLRSHIEAALSLRDTKTPDNTRELYKNNRPCS